MAGGRFTTAAGGAGGATGVIGTAAWAAATAGSTNVGTGGRTRVGAFASGTSSVPEAVATALLGATGVGGKLQRKALWALMLAVGLKALALRG